MDEDKLNSASARLEDLELECKERLTRNLPLLESLETRLIVSDVRFLLATIYFNRGGIYHNFKAWFLMRRAWKMYHQLEAQMVLLNKEIFEFIIDDSDKPLGFRENPSKTEHKISVDLMARALSYRNSYNPEILDKSTCIRLMRGASWGPGMIELHISMMPPSALKYAKFLGMAGNRDNALAKLNYCKNGTGMRSLLSLVVLLWYHTVARPIYYLDGVHPQVCIPIAVKLIKRGEKEFGGCSLFWYFQGRLDCIKKETDSAINCFYQCAEITLWRELRLLALHELGFCYMIQLRYWDAEVVYMELLKISRWSRCFYAYCLLINSAADFASPDVDDFDSAAALYEHDPFDPHLEEVVTTRRHLISGSKVEYLMPRYWRLLIYEVLYLHLALPICTDTDLQYIIDDCELVSNSIELEPFEGLSNLIAGSAYHILKDDYKAYSHLKECLAKRRNNLDSSKLSVYTIYEMGQIFSLENPLFLENVRYLYGKNIIRLKNWRCRLRTCPPYRILNFNALTMCYFMIFVSIAFLPALLILAVIPNHLWESKYNHKYPLTKPIKTGNVISYSYAVVADLDDSSSTHATDKGYWTSNIIKGRLDYNTVTGTVTVEFEKGAPKELSGQMSYNMHGLELSDLVVYNGKLFFFDEQTGILYEMVGENNYYPWVILLNGDGNNDIPFITEWSAHVDDTLYVGSLGREILAGEADMPEVGIGCKYIKKITMDGSVTHVNWAEKYERIKVKMGCKNGVVTHEAANWSKVHKRWFFLPRHCSEDTLDFTIYPQLGCSKLVTASEHVVDVNVIDIPTEGKERGFSAFRFLPNTKDTIIIAIRTEIMSKDVMASYITAFNIHGKIIMSDQKIESMKFGGFEFI